MKTLFACSIVALLCAACGKADDASPDSSDGGGGSNSSSSKGADAENPWDDVSKPCLTDKNMGSFIESLKDPNGPFDAVLKGKVTAFNTGKVMDDFEAAAKKHGFASGAEYLSAWMRIGAANTQCMIDEGNQSMIKMHEETIKQHQETLKKPEVTPAMKETLEGQIKGSQLTLEALKKPHEGGVNAKDMEMFKKHKAAFEESMKKWSK